MAESEACAEELTASGTRDGGGTGDQAAVPEAAGDGRGGGDALMSFYVMERDERKLHASTCS
jgi:hypothetical protein